MFWYLYIVQYKYGLYTGITVDIEQRIKQHNAGKGAKSLRGKGPVKLVYTEKFQTHKLAARREIEIKGWSKRKKLDLIKGFPFNPLNGFQGA